VAAADSLVSHFLYRTRKPRINEFGESPLTTPDSGCGPVKSVTRVTTCEARRLFIGLPDTCPNLVGYHLLSSHNREARWLPANCRDARIFADWKSRTTRDTISLPLRSIVDDTHHVQVCGVAFGFLPRQLAISCSRQSDNRSRFRTFALRIADPFGRNSPIPCKEYVNRNCESFIRSSAIMRVARSVTDERRE